MAVTQRLDLRQSQTLVMTPQLQQAIKLLELSNQELTSYVEQELEQNPLLERGEDARSEYGDAITAESGEDGGRDEADMANNRDRGDPVDATEYSRRETLPDERDSPLDTDYENSYSSDNGAESAAAVAELAGLNSWRNAGTGGRSDFGDEDGFEQTLSREITLHEHLEQQLGLDVSDPTDRLIGLQIIDLVNEAGYVSGDLDAIAQRLNCSLERVEAVLLRLQQFDPVGICARNLAECLALQLRERDRLDPAMQMMLQNLDLLAKHDRAQLMKLCGVDAEDLADMVAEIRSLNPRPGASFEHVTAQTVVPEILVFRQPDGTWGVELNAETLPRLLVNQHYFTTVSAKTQNKQERDYLTERLSAANWLVKTLHQRATTILKVAAEIVRQQEAFFVHGIQYMKPLIRRDIATAIEMHESTVSRVATNKYMATPRGLFEMRYFFSAAIQGADGAASHSAEAVRSRLKELIDAEPVDAVLSDDQLVVILKEQGVDIARRTVAKYRESLKIPSSVQRRREKALRSG
jgi:RNA polymerase sigma-54 factor